MLKFIVKLPLPQHREKNFTASPERFNAESRAFTALIRLEAGDVLHLVQEFNVALFNHLTKKLMKAANSENCSPFLI